MVMMAISSIDSLLTSSACDLRILGAFYIFLTKSIMTTIAKLC